MSNTDKAYRVQVYQPGSTSTVEFTWDSQLGAVPIVGSQKAQPLKGSAVSKPWKISVVDQNEAVTNQLADSGRANLLGRLVAVQVNIDSGGWTTLAKGRLSGLFEAQQPGIYEVHVSDERFVERSNTIFTTTNTNRIHPTGLKSKWFDIRAAKEETTWLVRQTSGDDVQLMGDFITSKSILSLIREDLKEDAKPGASSGGVGNFNFLRANLNGGDRQVVSFNQSIVRSELVPAPNATISSRFLWVTWPSHGLSSLDIVSGYLHMDGSEPSETLPLHIGGDAGIDAMQLVKDVYDLNYGGDEAVRYDSTQFTALIGHDFVPRMWFRITKPMKMAEFVQGVYRALGLMPFVNGEGEVDPQFIRLQQNVDPATLTTIGPSEAVTAPTWLHSDGDLVTAIRLTFQRPVFLNDEFITSLGVADWPADRIQLNDHTSEYTHDNIADLGRHEITIPMAGFPTKAHVDRHARALVADIFSRWGDGPIEGDFDTLSTIDEAKGAWVLLSGLPIPNPQSNNRGDARVVQIMDRIELPVGFRYRYLDGGPNLAILLPPTVAIASNGGRPKNAVDVTITNLPASTTYELQLKIGSDPWIFYREGTANETVTVQNLPSNTTIQARARTADPTRIRSAWSSAVSQATTALTAPSALATTVSGRTIALTWTNGEADEQLMVTLDGAEQLNLPLEPGTTRYVFTELAASTLFTLGVKHIDPYGGESTLATDTATTGTAATLAALKALTVLQGAPATDVVHPTEHVFGAGVELGWTPTEPHAVVEIQVDDNSGFTSPDLHRGADSNSLRVPLPLNDTLQYFRARQVREGWTASAWSSTVSAKPVPFAETPGVADGFAGGFASLSFDTDNDIILNVGTADPDTDTAYFELNLTGFVEPTTGSSSIARSAMPYSQDQSLIPKEAETAYLWLKFHNGIKGFGQSVQHRITLGLSRFLPPPFSDLEWYGPFDEGSGLTLRDRSGNVRDAGQESGGAAITWVPGVAGMAIDFPGSGVGYELLSDAQAGAIEALFYVSCWIKVDTVAGDPATPRILSRNSGDYFAIRLEQDEAFPQDIVFNYSDTQSVTVNDVITTAGVWYFILAQWDQTLNIVELWVGSEATGLLEREFRSEALAAFATTSRPIVLGSDTDASPTSTGPFDGSIDDVRIGAPPALLTHAQVLSLFRFPGVPAIPAVVEPTWEVEFDRDAQGNATLTLTIKDPSDVIASPGPQFSKRAGSQVTDTWGALSAVWDTEPTNPPYAGTWIEALVVPGGEEAGIRWQYSWVDQDGVTRTHGLTHYTARIDENQVELIFPCDQGIPIASSQGHSHTSAGAVQPLVANVFLNWLIPIPLPIGVVIEEFDARLFRDASHDTADCSLVRGDIDGNPTSIASLTGSTGGWSTQSNTAISEAVIADRSYHAEFGLRGVDSPADARGAWARVVYDRLSQLQVY
ncbi:MAG: LamG-like jellyroll fold domain-containing protein [Gemmatimonadota bacterium]